MMFYNLVSKLTKAVLFILFSTIVLNATVKIMPLGDSITWDWHYDDSRTDAERSGYRNYLWYKLKDAGYNVDFVGTKSNGGAIRPSFDGNNEGYTGYTTYQIRDIIYNRLQHTSPDIILLHIGTNDSSKHSVSMAITHLAEILDKIDSYEKTYNKHITVILARIIPLPKEGDWVTTFNNSLDDMVANRISHGDDIIKVNMNTITSLVDGIRPTNTGYEKMAKIWFNALEPILKPKHPRMMADVNVDGMMDIVGFGTKGVYVSLSTGSGFEDARFWIDNFGSNDGW